MHKLQRGKAPECLAKYKHGQDQWSNGVPTLDEKMDIWEQLEVMQGQRCGYCEADISSDHDKHIEHLRQRSNYPKGTFNWENIFGSCGRRDSCGNHKDRCGAYNHNDLIKPDIDDPEHFFHFNSNGTISIRKALSLPDQHRAKETLRVFNLAAENGALRWARYRAAYKYIEIANEISKLALDDLELAEQYLQAEISATAHHPFATAIKHTLLLALA